MSDLQKRVTPGRPKGCSNYPPEFKQRLIEASFEPGVSISRLALDNGINANLLFKWRQLWRQGKDSRIARQRIQSILLRNDRRYDKKPWGHNHRIWLANQTFPLPSQQLAFQHYCQSLEQIENRIEQLDQKIDRLLPEWSLYNLVCQLQALKGVGKPIAISLASELGDFSRFPNPKQIMAYIGLIPGEYSSGNKTRSRGITKTGNSELRKLLYEAAWAYRSPQKSVAGSLPTDQLKPHRNQKTLTGKLSSDYVPVTKRFYKKVNGHKLLLLLLLGN